MDSIQSAEPKAPGHAAARDAEKQEAVHTSTNGSDIEAAGSSQGDKGAVEDETLPLHRPDETELTPAEAFKWNVEGDQSPCESKLQVWRCNPMDAC
jgi:hypothetical protein